ncbi:MAG: threonylcarbamoyl-AMP synthase [Muribaculaceae bacterium]|nr:threonylcarbamoyl-AMP synthase [Muribaculaceae bacterium]
MQKETRYNPESRYNPEDLAEAVKTVREGGIILYPTDTVWGIGCDATNPEAVERIYKLKRRADSKSMLALTDSVGSLYRWLKNVPETALMLIDAAVDPLTIIYDSPSGIAGNLLAPDGSLGIRITCESFSEALCRRARIPVVSTSANISGQKTPALFREISEEIINGVDYVVKFRRNDSSRHKPSGIIKVTDDETLTIIR